MDELWTLQWFDVETGAAGIPVPPSDSSMSDDEGLLVYRSQKAAELSAEHQTDMYGDSETVAKAVKLSELLASGIVQN